jgi:hypothetical protein
MQSDSQNILGLIKNLRPIWIIIIAIIITALVVGSGMYFVMNKIGSSKKVDLEKQIEELKQQIDQFKNVEISNEKNAQYDIEKKNDEFYISSPCSTKEKHYVYHNYYTSNHYINNPVIISGRVLSYKGGVLAKIKDDDGNILGESSGNIDDHWYQTEITYRNSESTNGIVEVCKQAILQEGEIECVSCKINFIYGVNKSKEYIDEKAGFSLNLPSSVIFAHSEPNIIFENSKKLSLSIVKEKIELLNYPGNNKETALQQQEVLSRGELVKSRGSFIVEDSKKVVKIGNIYAESFVQFRYWEMYNNLFHRKLVFYNNGYQINITLTGPKDIIMDSIPSKYLTKDDGFCSDHNPLCLKLDLDKDEIFYQDLVEGNGPKVAQEWFDTFDEIINTIEIY